MRREAMDAAERRVQMERTVTTTTPAIETDRSIRYDPAAIEPKWRQRWQEDDLYRVDDDAPGEKF